MEQKKKTFYVTTPIYYASGSVHIGNTYSTIVADTIRRFKAREGYDTRFLTGMDEHGLKIQQASEKAGETPQAHVDRIARQTAELWRYLNISNDDFIQTSEKRHTVLVQKAFEQMLAQDDIYLGQYEGMYCVSCEAFWTKTQVGDAGVCPDCGKPLVKASEPAYFLRLSKYQDWLLDYIATHPDFIQPESRRNEVVSFVKSGLEDLCVSRTTFSWGIPVLSNPKHVVYVWIDALLNYITALGWSTTDDGLYQKYWKNGDEVVNIVGKDIVRFHAVYWPIMLKALGALPEHFHVYAHGWILMKEGKMSKSKGNVIYPRDVVERYGLDPFRLFMMHEMPVGNDAIFSYDLFVEKYNVMLANDLGNLVNRTLAMVNKYQAGLVTPGKTASPFSAALESEMDKDVSAFRAAFTEFRFQDGIDCAFALVDKANKYVDSAAPWTLAKDPANAEELKDVLYHLFETLRLVAGILAPVMPDTAKDITAMLGLAADTDNDTLVFGRTASATVTKTPKILFQRLDKDAELAYQASRLKDPRSTPLKPEVTYDDFAKLDLRVGKVLSCTRKAGSDKLLVFRIQIEDEERTILSGIGKTYAPEDLVGKSVVVVANLKPRKIMGETSQGMILSAESGEDHLELLTLAETDTFGKVS